MQARLDRLEHRLTRLDVRAPAAGRVLRSEEHTSELQSLTNLVCRLLLEKKKNQKIKKIRNDCPSINHCDAMHFAVMRKH